MKMHARTSKLQHCSTYSGFSLKRTHRYHTELIEKWKSNEPSGKFRTQRVKFQSGELSLLRRFNLKKASRSTPDPGLCGGGVKAGVELKRKSGSFSFCPSEDDMDAIKGLAALITETLAPEWGPTGLHATLLRGSILKHTPGHVWKTSLLPAEHKDPRWLAADSLEAQIYFLELSL